MNPLITTQNEITISTETLARIVLACLAIFLLWFGVRHIFIKL